MTEPNLTSHVLTAKALTLLGVGTLVALQVVSRWL